MQSISFPRYLVPLSSKYSPQQPVLKHRQPTLLPQYQRPSFTPIQDNGQDYSSIYLDFLHFWTSTWTTEDSAPNDNKHSPNFSLLLISSWIEFWFVNVVPKYLHISITVYNCSWRANVCNWLLCLSHVLSTSSHPCTGNSIPGSTVKSRSQLSVSVTPCRV